MSGRVLYMVTEDWYFRSHRLALARAARDAGYRVTVATRLARHAAALAAEGFELVHVPFDRSLRRPDRDLAAFLGLRRLLRERRHDVVHAISLKPILLGLAASPVPARVIASFTGLGYTFSSRDLRAQPIRTLVSALLRYQLRGGRAWLTVQNEDDRALLAAAGIGVPERTVLIAGSGVSLAEFPATPQPGNAVPLVVLPARVLVDKGVREFVGAARLLRDRGRAARFALVGAHDTHNPGAVPARELAAWREEGVVEIWGHRDDVPAVLAGADVVCLPSYREGLPKALLEAAACGRALVATDVPGCRAICRDGETGCLVPPGDVPALADAIEHLLADGGLRAALGAAGHALVENRFATERVNAQTLALYTRVIDAAR